jgi:putative transferase (TIGR04331 family)
MFLVTTPNQKYWKDNEKFLFLGEWCKLNSQKQIWDKPDHKTLPHHWEDREVLHKDLNHINPLYEKYLKHLGEQFNQIHRVDFSTRYWRIIIGHWLYLLITTLYDRFHCIQTAIDSKLVTNTCLASLQPDLWVCADSNTFRQRCYGDDNYNLYVFSRIIKKLKVIPFEINNDLLLPAESDLNPLVPSQSALKKLGKLFYSHYARLIPDSLNQIVFSNCYLSKADQSRLQLSLGQLPYWSSEISIDQLPLNHQVRSNLNLPVAENEFESLLNEMIPENIPTAYVEGYETTHQNSLKAFPKSPKCIVTAMAQGMEGFNFWAAFQIERGVKLFLTQHGGGYGAHLWSFFESHEINISDKYLTWGWKTKGSEVTTPLASGKLTYAKKMLQPNPKGSILWVTMSLPRYARMHISDVLGPEIPLYHSEQKRFAKSVSTEVHDLLLQRLYVEEYGWEEYKRWADFDSTLKLYQGKTPLFDQLNQSRLCIVTNNATVYLENFSANFPTILFWNPKYIEVRDSVKPYFDDLRRVGVLHDTPESAAAKVNDVYNDPISWWKSSEIQEVKNKFCLQFARSSDDWIHQWKEKLYDLTTTDTKAV